MREKIAAAIIIGYGFAVLLLAFVLLVALIIAFLWLAIASNGVSVIIILAVVGIYYLVKHRDRTGN